MSFDSTWNYVNSAVRSSTAQVSVTNAVGYIQLTADGGIKYGGSYTSDLNSAQLSAISSGGFTKIFAGGYGMYAAQKANGSLLIFGYVTNNSADEVSIINKLLNSVVTEIRFNYGAGAAKLSDGTVVTWGHNGYEAAAAALLNSPSASSGSSIDLYVIPPIYTIRPESSFIDEGSIAYFLISTENVAEVLL